ncbi:hypothetical protein J5N97_027592 [Dioscorea zingiberensis]|uniref:Uncharacterized protein n=1 Tax=Dioscorea zingiberensis TaxID=325984 RepID=A0A9D5H7S5_9LILI|nr:hypothetical protein J5N97_027592 [Dioscorea zingiberensis]
MKGSTKLALGATAAAVSLTLILMASLLLDLLFSILRRRRRSPSQASQSRATPASPPSPLSKPLHLPLYGHGVLQVPSSDFLLSVPKLEAATATAAAAAKLADQAANSDHFVRICNPIFDEACGLHGVNVNAMDDVGDGTPFETPGSSPSCFELEEGVNSEPSPPLKFMKKLPSFLPAASSVVCLVDGRRSLAASVSATETNKASSSSSSSNSLCFSPSW